MGKRFPFSDVTIKIPYQIDIYYINQPHNPSFPIGLVKTKSDFIVRLVETGLWRWTLVVALISVDAYPFWISMTWPITFRIHELVLSGRSVPPDSKDTKLESSNQEASLSAGKNTEVVLGLCCAWNCVPTSVPVVWIFRRSLYVICYNKWVLSEGHKNYFKDWCLVSSQPTFLFLTYF